jgi:hypothetical protein
MKFFSYPFQIIFIFSLAISFAKNSSAEEMDDQSSFIIMPKKVIAYLMNFKDEANKNRNMPEFSSLLQELDLGKRSLSKELVAGALSELDRVNLSDEKKGDQNVSLYLEKIKRNVGTRKCCGTINDCPTQACPPSNPCPCPGQQHKLMIEPANTFTTRVAIKDTTESGSCDSGALTVAGGVGIQGALNVCGQEKILNELPSNDCADGALVVLGGVGIGQNMNICGPVAIANTTQSFDCSSGALTVAGGEGVAGNLNVCGQVHIMNSTASTNCSTGALIVDGGIAIQNNANICGQLNILNTTKSTKCNNGALVVSGGEGILGDLNICGKERIFNASKSDACNNGALVVDGGVGIGQDVNVCGGINAQGPITTNSFFSINGSSVIASNIANCNLSVGDNTNPVSNGTGNTAVGESAMQNNLTGIDNTALGCQALMQDTAGNSNTAGGFQALRNLNSGNGNTAFGSQASYNELCADDTVAVGYQALYTNQASANVAVGAYAIHNDTFAANLTAVGFRALEKVHSIDIVGVFAGYPYAYHYYGNGNTAVGPYALQNTPYGYSNIAVGVNAIQGNVGPGPLATYTPHVYSNVGVGNGALANHYIAYNNTTGGHGTLGGNYAFLNYGNTTWGLGAMGGNYTNLNTNDIAVGASALGGPYLFLTSDNCAVGNNALGALTYYGENNVAVGDNAIGTAYFALRNTACGVNALGSGSKSFLSAEPIFDNTAVGFQALQLNYADYNTAVGSEALQVNTEGIFNTAVGFQAIQLALDEFVTAIGANTVSEGALNTLAGYAARAIASEQAIVIGTFPTEVDLSSMGIAMGNEVFVTTSEGAIGIGDVVTVDISAQAIGMGNEIAVTMTEGAICIGNIATIDLSLQGIAIGNEMAVTSSEGAVTMGSLVTENFAFQDIGIGNEVALTTSDLCHGIGDGVTIDLSSTSVCFGNALAIGLGVDCVVIGDGIATAGFNTISVGTTAVTIPDGVNLGLPWPINQFCQLGGVEIGPFDPALVMSLVTPVPPLVIAGPCPICFITPFSESIEIIDNPEIKRSQSEKITDKLMALEPINYSLRKLNIEAIKRGEIPNDEIKLGFTAEQVMEICPDWVIESPSTGDKYILADKLILMLLQQVQIQQNKLKEHENEFDIQTDEIIELRKQINQLNELVAKLVYRIKLED